MGAVGRTITNVVQAVTKPVEKLVTQPSKLNLGDAVVLGTAGLAAPTVDAVRHPGDAPIIAAGAVGGAALAGAVLPSSIAAADAASSVAGAETASASASSYSASFASGGGGPGYGLIGTSNPLDLSYVAPTLAPATGATIPTLAASTATSSSSFLGSVFSGVSEVAKTLLPTVIYSKLFSSLNNGNSGPPGGASSAPQDNGGSNQPGGPVPIGATGGYGPFGSSYPTPGTPGATDASAGLIPNLFSGSSGSLLIWMSLAVFTGWYFFLRKKHS